MQRIMWEASILGKRTRRRHGSRINPGPESTPALLACISGGQCHVVYARYMLGMVRDWIFSPAAFVCMYLMRLPENSVANNGLGGLYGNRDMVP